MKSAESSHLMAEQRRATGERAAESDVLVCAVDTRRIALPIGAVAETMRPLPVEPFGGMPGYVLGLATIRGLPTPVVDMRRLFGIETAQRPGRFVTLMLDGRAVALAVDSVLGLQVLNQGDLAGMPPLLSGANAGVVSSIGTLDQALLVVMKGAAIVPEEMWRSLK